MGFDTEVAAFGAEELCADLDAPVVRVAGPTTAIFTDNSPEQPAVLPDIGMVTAAARSWLRTRADRSGSCAAQGPGRPRR
jgi:pyruvate/2-oxoglutarate/acetoin dehydrogenase E1 component